MAHGNLSELQITCLISTGFATFLRWDDLKDLTRGNLLTTSNHMSISLMKRKNDHFREGSSILVARTSPSSCPIAIMEWFLLAGQHQETDYLLRKIHVCHPKRGFSLHLQPLTYPRDSELANKCLKTVGLNPKQYGPHGLRFSGALQQPQLLSQTGCSCVIAAGVRSQLRTCTSRKWKKPSLGFPENST